MTPYNLITTVVLLLPINQGTLESDWFKLTQKPYANAKIAELGQLPLLEKSDTKELWEIKKKDLFKLWIKELGVFPQKPESLKIKFESTEKMEDHCRTLISFESDKSDRMRAFLLTTNGLKENEKRPAIIVFHQTTKDTIKEPVGLGPNPNLALALHLVKRGYMVLAPECFIMKEKGPQAQAIALPIDHPNLTGMGKMVYDAIRCVDLLESLENINPLKIGCIGFSLGAKEVLFSMAFETRLKVGVFNEGGIGLRMSNYTDPWYLTSKMKKNIPQMENHQVMALIAPRPLLIMGGNSADGDASWPFVYATLPVYKLYSADDKIGLINHLGKHSFPYEARKTAYRWLDHWLEHKPTSDEAGPIQIKE